MTSQRAAHGVADERSGQAVERGAVVDLAHEAHFHAKERAGKRGAERRAERRGDAGHHEVASIVALYVEQARHIARDGAAHLHRGSLASGRAAGQMRCGGAQEGERGHANVDRRAGDGAVDDEVVAALRAQAVVAVEPGCRDVYDREQGEQPYVGFARCGGHVEGGEERPAAMPMRTEVRMLSVNTRALAQALPAPRRACAPAPRAPRLSSF